jgi:hypothetical protein
LDLTILLPKRKRVKEVKHEKEENLTGGNFLSEVAPALVSFLLIPVTICSSGSPKSKLDAST